MMTFSPEIAQTIAVARRYAALSGVFEPKGLLEALDTVGPVSTDVAVAVTADLAHACDTAVDSNGWLMRGSVRERVLDEAAPEGLREAVDWRRSLETDAATEDLLAALVGDAPYEPEAVLETARSTPDRPTLERLALALDRAGRHAPARDALDAVRSALGRVDSQMRYEAILGAGFFGREAELVKLASWTARPTTEPPVRALLVSGLPGIGKSTLVEEASRRAANTPDQPAIVIRFDFDRGGLDIQDLVGLTLEFSRQVAIELGEKAASLSQARVAAAGTTPTSRPAVKGETLEHVPQELAAVLGEVVQQSGRPLLIVLDTLEVLRGRGETHPERLFRFFDQLVARGAHPMAILAAGRGDALDSAPDRLADRINLPGLEPAQADAMLRSLQVPESAFEPIRNLADGNPLVLRLAALTTRKAGATALQEVKGKREVAAAYLYRFLLSRIDNDKLRALAEPGLVVRRINPDVISEVLVPALGLPALGAGEAATLYEDLSSHHWLVEQDAVSGWVRHRSDIRPTLLRLLYDGTNKTKAARVNRAAARWFANRPEPFAAVESAYHQLQAMRTGSRPVGIEPHVLAQLDRETVAELPVRAQDLVRSLRGQRTSLFRTSAEDAIPSRPDLAAAATELGALLERGDLIEAGYVHERSFAAVEPVPGSPEADVHLAFLWRTGRWTEAARVARTHTFPWIDRGAEWWRRRPPATALAQLEVWAELRFAEAVRQLRRDPELAALVVELSDSGIKGSLANGALGFALLAAGLKRPRSTWSLENPIDAAAAAWSAKPSAQPITEALSGAATRFEALVSPAPRRTAETTHRSQPQIPNPETSQGAARLLATSTPYGSVVEAMRRDGDEHLLSHLSGAVFEVAEQDGLPPTGAGGWSVAPAVSPDGLVETLAALGLLAEWLGAAAFVVRHTDLRQIAQCAERWRRTTAGDWAYPTRPAHIAGDDVWASRPDATISDRIEQLASARDPVSASRDQLALWWHTDETDVVNRIERRRGDALQEARRAALDAGRKDASAAAAVALLKRRIPSAFVPPLAVLITTDKLDWRLR
jgi:hypothetical protein